jgi:hypothetical protein
MSETTIVEVAFFGKQGQRLHAIARKPKYDGTVFDMAAKLLPDQVLKVGLVVDDEDFRCHARLVAASSRRPISPRSSGKSIGLVNSPAAPASVSFCRVSASP